MDTPAMAQDSQPTQTRSRSLDPIEYEYVDTGFGTLKRFVYDDGRLFEEFISHSRPLGLPLYHRTSGINPETGKTVAARGFIAKGRFAYGFLAIGQVAWGLIAIGQVAIGILFGLGQAASGLVTVGQLGLSAFGSLAQFGVGYTVVAQFGYGEYVLAQFGLGEHVWDMRNADPAAVNYFQQFFQ